MAIRNVLESMGIYLSAFYVGWMGKMPAKYRRPGLRFEYPENWTLEEERSGGGGASVTVYSPGGAFWTVALHPRETSPLKLVEAVVQAMREEYTDLDVEEVREITAGHELIGYDLAFFYLDLTNTAKIRSLRTRYGTYSFFYQGEDREFDAVEKVFQAMTASLLKNLDDPRLWD